MGEHEDEISSNLERASTNLQVSGNDDLSIWENKIGAFRLRLDSNCLFPHHLFPERRYLLSFDFTRCKALGLDGL